MGTLEGPFFSLEPGTETVTLFVSPVFADGVFEGDETFSVELVSVSEGVIGDISSAVVTILDANCKCRTASSIHVYIALCFFPKLILLVPCYMYNTT